MDNDATSDGDQFCERMNRAYAAAHNRVSEARSGDAAVAQEGQEYAELKQRLRDALRAERDELRRSEGGGEQRCEYCGGEMQYCQGKGHDAYECVHGCHDEGAGLEEPCATCGVVGCLDPHLSQEIWDAAMEDDEIAETDRVWVRDAWTGLSEKDIGIIVARHTERVIAALEEAGYRVVRDDCTHPNRFGAWHCPDCRQAVDAPRDEPQRTEAEELGDGPAMTDARWDTKMGDEDAAHTTEPEAAT